MDRCEDQLVVTPRAPNNPPVSKAKPGQGVVLVRHVPRACREALRRSRRYWPDRAVETSKPLGERARADSNDRGTIRAASRHGRDRCRPGTESPWGRPRGDDPQLRRTRSGRTPGRVDRAAMRLVRPVCPISAAAPIRRTSQAQDDGPPRARPPARRRRRGAPGSPRGSHRSWSSAGRSSDFAAGSRGRRW